MMSLNGTRALPILEMKFSGGTRYLNRDETRPMVMSYGVTVLTRIFPLRPLSIYWIRKSEVMFKPSG